MSEAYLRTRFLERVAHDLRGAASTAGGALAEIEHALTITGDDTLRFATIVRRGIFRILRISESLVEAAELERGNVALSRGPCRLAEIVQSAVDDARTLENRRDIEVTVQIRKDLVVVADSARLSRVIFELSSNAIRAAVKEVVISADESGDAVTFFVTDDGAGCPPPVLRFTPSDSRRGLGLGLAMAVEIVAAHGGRLEFGREGVRTRVAITLTR